MKKSFIVFLTSVLFVASCSKNNAGTTPVITIHDTPSVITFAGTGSPGSSDGTKQGAAFNFPSGIAMATSGFVFIADNRNNLIRIMSPQGVVNTIAGTLGKQGFSNAKDSVTFNFPTGLAVDPNGNVFVADQGNAAIREINTQGTVTTFAVGFIAPTDVATDAAGNLYVTDLGANMIREITPKGVVTTFAGTGVRGHLNGAGTVATFNQPHALAADAAGNIYVADEGNNLVRKITPQGMVSTLAGSGSPGNANGQGAAASFNGPAGIAVDSNGNVYVADSNNNLIRKITAAGMVTTLAGTGAAGSANGGLASSSFNNPQSVVVDQYDRIFVVDTGNSLIRLITQ